MIFIKLAVNFRYLFVSFKVLGYLFNKKYFSLISIIYLFKFQFIQESTVEYIKESESSSFFLRLHGSKWLKRVSSLLQLTSKIINCLHFDEHNVFLEEFRGNIDCSCILTSLVKICMNRKCRKVAGFENLIQKEWFLAGHMFCKRLETSLANNSDEFMNETERTRTSLSNTAIDSSVQANSSNLKANGQIAPTFLVKYIIFFFSDYFEKYFF